MKRFLFTTMIALAGLVVSAQNLERIKEMTQSKKYEEAKALIDKYLSNTRNAKEAEGWYTKAKIYAEIANDSVLKASNPGAREAAFEAIKKYVELDDKLIFMQLENYKPIFDIYQGYYRDGAALYNKGNFAAAYDEFKNCLTTSDYMIEKKWSNQTMDTSVILYTGIAAEKAGKKDEAAMYYGKLAQAKVKDEGLIEIYKWLVDHYNQKKDQANTDKYLALGKELYPQDLFWQSYELDMAREKGDKQALFAKYEDIINSHPNQVSYRYNYAVELYHEAYNPDISKRPANSVELISKVEDNIKKVLEANPNNPQALLILGQIYYNQAVDLNVKYKAIKAPANGKLSPEDQKTKDELKGQVTQKFDQALPYLEKIEQLLGSQGKLKMEDKTALKDALDIMTTIYDQKHNKEKMKEYETKYNNVEKEH